MEIFETKKRNFLKIIHAIDAPNHQRLSRPPYATSELYQIMLHCWKHQSSERPTFSQLEKTLGDVKPLSRKEEKKILILLII
jgi:hypothetical protein